MTRSIADWLLTWWLHSALMTGLALLVATRVRGAAERDVTWKVALLLPLLTSGLVAFAPATPTATLGIAAAVRPLVPDRWNRLSVDERVIRTPTGVIRSTIERDPLASGTSAALVVAAMLGAMIGLAGFTRRALALHRLRATRHAPSGSVPVLTGITITESDALHSPVALTGREICVTPLCFTLPEREQRALFAHELAHLERRDPEWFMALDLLTSLLLVQPLSAVVLRRLRRDAEFVCDEEAVRRTGDPASLLSSIIAFAGAPRDARLDALAAYTTSPIVERGARIAAMARGAPPRRMMLAVVCALLLGAAVPLAAPALMVRASRTAVSEVMRDGVRVEVDSQVLVRAPARLR
ncbi:MAG: putative rane protein [Gemmatimonadetes bacterium]|nr:putative rane protein [Gemmatimonadota bacterium]